MDEALRLTREDIRMLIAALRGARPSNVASGPLYARLLAEQKRLEDQAGELGRTRWADEMRDGM